MQDTNLSIFFVALGFFGVFAHMIVKTQESGGVTIPALWDYIKGNSLSFLMANLTYVFVVAIWYFNGLDFLGLMAGQLTGMTPFIGYTSTSIFKTVAKARVTAKAEAEEKKTV